MIIAEQFEFPLVQGEFPFAMDLHLIIRPGDLLGWSAWSIVLWVHSVDLRPAIPWDGQRQIDQIRKI
jgi:hypothetical protein